MNRDIVFIATNTSQVSSIRKYLKKKSFVFPIYSAQIEKALKIAQAEVAKGAKVIVSRGTTALYLRKYLSVPVVEVRHCIMDIHLAMEKARKQAKNIAIVGGENLCNTASLYAKISENKFLIKKAIWHADIEKVVEDLSQQGIEALIGGFCVEKCAKLYNLKYYSTGADLEAIYRAAEEALHNAKVIQERKEELGLIKTVLNNVSEGIVSFKADGNLIHINEIAKKFLKYQNGKLITNLLPPGKYLETARSGKPQLNELMLFQGQYIVLNTVPIKIDDKITGAVTTIHKEQNINKLDFTIRQKHLGRGHIAKKDFENIIGTSKVLETVKKNAKLYAKSDGTVLIWGETGTGKELFAQSIHNYSKRKQHPFVAVNCAALPENVLESELFGYVKGAFTGARSEGKEGLFEMAHHGTIFLDEISEISTNIQVKLLRVVEEKEICRLGDNKIIPVDVHIIAACNKNLPLEIQKGNFREDLYYRLSVLELNLPPLRERKQDIPELIDFLLKENCGNKKTMTPAAKQLLKQFDWPGNIRQLSNIIRRLIVISEEEKSISQNQVLEVLHGKIYAEETFPKANLRLDDNQENGLIKLAQKELIEAVLVKTAGNKKKTAELLGIGTTTLWRKIKQMELENFTNNSN